MNFLFIHANYPAQFKNLAPLLAGSGHQVVFLTQREDAQKYRQQGINIINYSLHRPPSRNTHHYLQDTEEAILQGQAILRALNDLRSRNFIPEFIITHGGMGMGLFIKEFYPEAIHVGYFEWYFRRDTTQYLVEKLNLDTQLRSSLRNLPILQELDCCDIGVTPTHWQKNQFPREYQKKLNVIFDGIDIDFFHQCKNYQEIQNKKINLRNRETNECFSIESNVRLLSYATRGMEPLRGFPEFVRSLPKLFNYYSDLRVVIAGADRQAYSYGAPTNNGSWKQHLLKELEGKIPLDKVYFTGLLNYEDYRMLLWRSNLHCYFTRPYVTSWSLFEAAACGAHLAVNKNPATAGIIKEETASWVSLDDQSNLTDQLITALSEKGRRSEILPGFDLQTSMEQWEKLLNRTLQNS